MSFGYAHATRVQPMTAYISSRGPIALPSIPEAHDQGPTVRDGNSRARVHRSPSRKL